MPLKPNQIILIALTLIASAYALVAIFKWWWADAAFTKGKNLADAGYLTQALPPLQQAVKFFPTEPLYHDGLADVLAKTALALSQTQATASAQQVAQLAVQESDLTLKLNPVHLNFWKTRIRLLLYLSEIDPTYQAAALSAFNQALSLSPTDAKLYYNLALLELQLGQVATAKITLQKTLELKPDYAAARQALEQLNPQ